MAKREPELEQVAPNTLREASWNPPGRINDRRMRYLMASIDQYGWVQTDPIILARDAHTNEWVVADGHRRRAAAIRKNVEYVTVMRNYDLTAQQYYAMRNGTSSPPSVKETGQAVLLGLDVIPPSHQRSMDELLKACDYDWERVRAILAQGKSAGIITNVQRIVKYLNADFNTKGDKEFETRTLDWVVRHNMGLTSSRAIQDGIKPEVLFQKIMDDQPIRTGYN